MAKTSTLTLSVAIAGDGVSSTYAPPTSPVVNAAAPLGGTLPQALSSGDNAIAVPTGAQGVLIVPPAGSAVTKKLKGAGGDAGMAISPSLPTMISLPPATASILVNASGGETITLLWL